jgi:two-component system chemotaxis response regulator CheB
MTELHGRVLIVDDSAFMRIALRHIVDSEQGMSVVGEARSGTEAIALAAKLKPDIITMYIEMAGIDGLAAAREILAAPAPHPFIIMVSSHTRQGAATTIEALHIGAVDFVSKSSEIARQDLGHVDSELRTKLHFWARQPRRALAVATVSPAAASPANAQPANAQPANARPAATPPVAAPPAVTVPFVTVLAGRTPAERSAAAPAVRMDLVVVGASTGGPAMLGKFLSAAGRLSVPMVIAQHMPARYTASLAELLRNETGLDVSEGTHHMALRPGNVVFIPGGADGVIAPGPSGYELRLTTSAANVHPSVDLLFSSAAVIARKPVAVILTGMGQDGTGGARRLRGRGLSVLVQSPETCVVDGMPGAAIAAGVATEVLTAGSIGQRLATLSTWTIVQVKPSEPAAGAAE